MIAVHGQTVHQMVDLVGITRDFSLEVLDYFVVIFILLHSFVLSLWGSVGYDDRKRIKTFGSFASCSRLHSSHHHARRGIEAEVLAVAEPLPRLRKRYWPTLLALSGRPTRRMHIIARPSKPSFPPSQRRHPRSSPL